MQPQKNPVNKAILVSKENEVNRIIRNQKKSKTKVRLLFLSLWDDICNDLLDKIQEKDDYTIPTYVINHWDSPNSVTIFRTTKVPALVTLSWNKTLKKDMVVIEDYVPSIYKELGA